MVSFYFCLVFLYNAYLPHCIGGLVCKLNIKVTETLVKIVGLRSS